MLDIVKKKLIKWIKLQQSCIIFRNNIFIENNNNYSKIIVLLNNINKCNNINYIKFDIKDKGFNLFNKIRSKKITKRNTMTNKLLIIFNRN